MYINSMGVGQNFCDMNLLQTWESGNLSPFSHYIFAFVTYKDYNKAIQFDGSIAGQGDGDGPIQTLATKPLQLGITAQNNGKKIMVSFGGASMSSSFWYDVWATAFSNIDGVAGIVKGLMDIFDTVNAQGLELDGVDFDYEPMGDVQLCKLDNVIELTKQTRAALDARKTQSGLTTPARLQYYISHAPQPPYMQLAYKLYSQRPKQLTDNINCQVCPPPGTSLENTCMCGTIDKDKKYTPISPSSCKDGLSTACPSDPKKQLTNCVTASYLYINDVVGDHIDFYFMQLYNNEPFEGASVGNTSTASTAIVQFFKGLTQGVCGFKPIEMNKLVVGKPGNAMASHAIGVMSASEITKNILVPLTTGSGVNQVMPGVGFWQWGGAYGIQGAGKTQRISDADLVQLGITLNYLDPNHTPDTSTNVCENVYANELCKDCTENGAKCNLDINHCMCPNGYSGTTLLPSLTSDCTVTLEDDAKSACTGGNGFTCNGNGFCDINIGALNPKPSCKCASGYGGNNCDTVMIPPTCPMSNGLACDGHGTCIPGGPNGVQCSCIGTYQGAACTEKIPQECLRRFPEGCVHGTCYVESGTAKCKCDDSWEVDEKGQCTQYIPGPWVGWSSATYFGDKGSWPGGGSYPDLNSDNITDTNLHRYPAAMPWPQYFKNYHDRTAWIEAVNDSAKGLSDAKVCYEMQYVSTTADKISVKSAVDAGVDDPNYPTVYNPIDDDGFPCATKTAGGDCIDINDDKLLPALDKDGKPYPTFLIVPFELCGGDGNKDFGDVLNTVSNINVLNADYGKISDVDIDPLSNDPSVQCMKAIYDKGNFNWSEATKNNLFDAKCASRSVSAESKYGKVTGSLEPYIGHANSCTGANMHSDQMNAGLIMKDGGSWPAGSKRPPQDLASGGGAMLRYRPVPCSIRGPFDPSSATTSC
jgi:hypothetical protein